MKIKRIISTVMSMAIAVSCTGVLNVSAEEEEPSHFYWDWVPTSTINEWIKSNAYVYWVYDGTVYSGEDASGTLSTGNTWNYSNDVLYIHGSEAADAHEICFLINVLHAHAVVLGKEVNIYKKFTESYKIGINVLVTECRQNDFTTTVYGYNGSPAQEAYEEFVSYFRTIEVHNPDEVRETFPMTFIDSLDNFVPEIIPDNPYYVLMLSDYEYYPDDDMLVFRGGKLSQERITDAFFEYKPSIVYISSDVTIGEKGKYDNHTDNTGNSAMYVLTFQDSFLKKFYRSDNKRIWYDAPKEFRVITEYGSDAYKTFEEDIIGYALKANPNDTEVEVRSRYTLEIADNSEKYSFLDKVRNPVADEGTFSGGAEWSYDSDSKNINIYGQGTFDFDEYLRLEKALAFEKIHLSRDVILPENEDGISPFITRCCYADNDISLTVPTNSMAYQQYKKTIEKLAEIGADEDEIRKISKIETMYIPDKFTAKFRPPILEKPCQIGEFDGVNGVLGDANGDGNISATDAVKIMSYITNPTIYPLDDKSLILSDVYNSGDGITNMDALEIQKFLAG